jgi:predicted SAM-dependent methyltransferase
VSQRLHLGGAAVREGWTIVNIQPGPGVDHVGSCTDLSAFADGSCAEVYASHVLEHLGYDAELPLALREIHRVLEPGGRLMFAVPDLDILCRLFVAPERTAAEKMHLMRMMFGGRIDAHDVHYSGLSWDLMQDYLRRAGFRTARRVAEFGLFDDASKVSFAGELISLSAEAWK